MSLNKLLFEGKVGEGLDLEVKSIATSTGSGSIIRGALTVVGVSDLQGNVTCERNLTVVDKAELFGDLKLGFPSKRALFDGVLTPAQRNLNGQAGNVSNLGGVENWNFQNYGNLLKINGQFVGSIPNAVANSFYVDFTLPLGYTSSTIGREVACGAGYNAVPGVDTQPYVLSSCLTLTSNTVRIFYTTGNGLPARVINAQNVFMFDMTLRNIVYTP